MRGGFRERVYLGIRCIHSLFLYLYSLNLALSLCVSVCVSVWLSVCVCVCVFYVTFIHGVRAQSKTFTFVYEFFSSLTHQGAIC